MQSNRNKYRILFVPGKNPKPPPDVHREQLWRCLLNGVERVDKQCAAEIARNPKIFELAGWNATYYRNKYRSLDSDIPWIDLLLTQPGASDDDRRAALSLKKKFIRFAYLMGDRCHSLLRYIPSQWIKATVLETARYFNNTANISSQVREIHKRGLLAAWEDDCRILIIAHSMGSIVAYDSLWELWHERECRDRIDCLLTIGSPLGLRYVQHRLLGVSRSGVERYPGNIGRWINVSAHGDLVSLDRTLADDFKQMVDLKLTEEIVDHYQGIYNFFHTDRGLNVHRAYGYLVNPAVGRIIADWYRGGPG